MIDPARATGGMITVACPVSICCVDASFNQEHDGIICEFQCSRINNGALVLMKRRYVVKSKLGGLEFVSLAARYK
jgi:hypothetical protein